MATTTTTSTNNKSLTTTAAALLAADRYHLNLAHKILNVAAAEAPALAAVISATGVKNFGPACYWIDSKKARILVPCTEGTTTEAVDPKLAALVATATTATAAVLPAMAKRGAGRTEAEAAEAAVAAIATYCAEVKAAAEAKAAAVAARRTKAVAEIATYLEGQGLDTTTAAATASGLRWVKGVKDTEGRYTFKCADLVRGLFARHAAAVAALDAATTTTEAPAATEATAPEAPATEAPATEAANI